MTEDVDGSDSLSLRSSDPSSHDPGAIRFRALTLGCAALAIALRAWAADGRPEDWDGVDFTLAVSSFDVARQQPHFPGYPVYVACAKILHRLAGVPPAWCLEVIGIASSAGLLLVGAELLARHVSRSAALLGGLALAVHPACVLESISGHADASGLFLLALVVLLVAGGRRLRAGVLFGLLLGVRLSWWPFVAVLLLRGPEARPSTRTRGWIGLLLGVVAWFAPLLAFEGPQLLTLGASFTRGHFLDWGGTALGTSWRPLAWIRSGASTLAGGRFESAGLRTVAVFAAILAFAGACCAIRDLVRRRAVRPTTLLVWALPYGLWLLLAQNPASFRHSLPLLVPLVLLAPGARPRVIAPLLLSAWALLCYVHLSARSGEPAPVERLAQWLESSSPPGLEVDAVYAGASHRYLVWRGVSARVPLRHARSFEEVRLDLESELFDPRHVLISSELASPSPRSTPASARFERSGILGRELIAVFRYQVERGPEGFVRLTPTMEPPDGSPNESRRGKSP